MPRDECADLERFIAAARVVVAIVCVVAAILDSPARVRFASHAGAALAVYVVYAISLVALLRRDSRSAAGAVRAVHAVDLCWAFVLTSATGGLSSHFSPPLYVFALLTAATRWGFRETLATGFASLALLIVQAAAALAGLMGEPFRMGDLVMRSVWVLLVAHILGFLADRQKRLRFEALLLARIGTRVGVQHGFGASVLGVLDELVKAHAAKGSWFVTDEAATGRAFLWATGGERASEGRMIRPTELDRAGRDAYLFPVPVEADAWLAIQPRAGGRPKDPVILAVGPDGRRAACVFPVPDQLPGAPPWHSLIGVSVTAPEGWTGRLLLVDPDARAGDERPLRFLQTASRHVGPALQNVYLLRRLRSQVEAIERARVARELHDGVIQSLIGLEMQLDAARRKAGDSLPPAVRDQLAAIQQILTGEIHNVRELMQFLRPVQVDPRRLVEHLADIVDRFRHRTGIQARFVCDADEIDLPPRVCSELANAVREALTNVRKHSGASNVLARVTATNGGWQLSVEDDGRGFGFVGRLTHEELDARRYGPAVLKERARAMGGLLAIESKPGRGARVEISIPR